MDRISAIAADNKVYVDGVPRDVDLSKLRENGIHAVQFCHCPNRKATKAEIEYVDDPFDGKQPNKKIGDAEFKKEFGWLKSSYEKALPEEVVHRRIRANKQVRRAEELLEEVSKSGDDEAIKKVRRAVENRKNERDDVYAGKRKQMDRDGLLVRDDD